MNISIIGPGAVGGLIAARFAAAGHRVSVLARGAALDALRTRGVNLIEGGATRQIAVQAADSAAALGVQDIVVIALKAQALPLLAPSLLPLLGPETVVVPAMNGVPWWFMSDFGGAHAGMPLPAVDPSGAVLAALPVARVVGCVVHLAASSPAPGVAQLNFGNRIILGEPDGSASERLQRVAAAFTAAGFETETTEAIRYAIWYKLWGNLTMNPVTALTGATADRVLDDPLVDAFCQSMMREVNAVGTAIGLPIAQSPAERNQVTRKLGAFTPSMAQDMRAGRALELDALVTVVHDMARHVGVQTPQIDALLGLTRLAARVRGLYPPAA